MPDMYGRSACAAELALRDSVIQSIREGWRPVSSFEIPTAPGAPEKEACESPVWPETSEMLTTASMRARRPSHHIDELSASD